MSSFCNAMILLEQQPNSMSFLKACNPADFNFEDDLDIIVSSGFSPNSIDPNLIYSFVSREYFCYTWVFSNGESLYSIIILSKLNLPAIYYSFFRSLRNELPKDQKEIDPLIQFDFAYSLITHWKWTSQTKILAHLPQEVASIELDNTTMLFKEFNPYYFFSQSDIDEIWKLILVGRVVHITSDNPEILSRAVYSACNMISPIPFRDNFLITLNPDDERLQHLERFAIIATPTNVEIDSLKMIGTNFEAKAMNINSDVANSLRDDLNRRTSNVLEVLVGMMDRVLRTNPYNDILGKPYITDDIEQVFDLHKDNSKYKILPPSAFREMEHTKSIMLYRKMILYRSSFRNFFLSMNPEKVLKGMSKQHLKIISDQLVNLEKKFSNDKHFISVINAHKKVIKKLL